MGALTETDGSVVNRTTVLYSPAQCRRTQSKCVTAEIASSRATGDAPSVSLHTWAKLIVLGVNIKGFEAQTNLATVDTNPEAAVFNTDDTVETISVVLAASSNTRQQTWPNATGSNRAAVFAVSLQKETDSCGKPDKVAFNTEHVRVRRRGET